MSDADSNFNVIISKRSDSQQLRIQTQFRIELKTTYQRASDNISYLEIMTTIANAFGVKVYSRYRFLKGTICYSYFFVAGSQASTDKVASSFTKFPLYSSKFMDFLDWNQIRLKVLNRSIMSLQPEKIEECKKIKQGMNLVRFLTGIT